MRSVIAPGSSAHILSLLRSGVATTRPQLAERAGLSRSAVVQRVDALMAAGLIVEDGQSDSSGGRRALQLRFAHDAGVILVADLGKSHARLAVTDLAGVVLIEQAAEREIAHGPGVVLEWLEKTWKSLLAESGRDIEEVRGLGVGLPGPVDHQAGRVVSPPTMPGWDGYPVADDLTERFQVPAFVDNDVNIMALGEYWSGWRDQVDDFLFIKIATGIGCGIILDQQIRRGRQGAAGHLGHIPVPGYEDVVCGCGNTACVGAVARGMSSRLALKGHDTRNARDVVELAMAGVPDAVREVREVGRALGRVLASAVNLLNPEVIVIGGDLAAAQELLLAGVTEVVYQKALPLGTRGLSILPARLGDRAGIQGAAVMLLEHLFSTAAVDEAIKLGRF